MAVFDVIVDPVTADFSLVQAPRNSNRNAGGTTDSTFIAIDCAVSGIDTYLKLSLNGTTLLALDDEGNLTLSGQVNMGVGGTTLYRFETDNDGTPSHTVEGPNFHIVDATNDRTRVTVRSIGEMAVILQDESLALDEVSHGIQVFHKATGPVEVGFGTGLQLFLSDAGGTDREAGNLQVGLTATTAGAISTYVQLLCRNAGSPVSVVQGFNTGEVRAGATNGWYTAPNFAASTSHGQINFGNVPFDGAAGAYTGLSGGCGLAGNFSAAFLGRFIDVQRGGVSIYRMGNSGQQVMVLHDNQTTGANPVVQLEHMLTTGTPSIGFGGAIKLRGQDDALTQVDIAELRSTQAAVTAGAVSSNILLRHNKSGTMTTAMEVQATTSRVLFPLGIGVGNSAAATTLASPGTVVARAEIYNASGVSIGSFPIYNNNSFS